MNGRLRLNHCGFSPGERRGIEHLVIVLPADPSRHREVVRWLPPDLSSIHWPQATEIETIERLVRQRLQRPVTQPMRDLLGEGRTGELREQMRDVAIMPMRRRPLDDRPMVGVPSMPRAEFYGRARMLADMLRRLVSVEGQQSVALVGAPGSGKSRLALEFVWRYAEEFFPGGVVWVDASQPATREQQLYAILQRLEERVPSLADMHAAGISLESRLREELERRFTQQCLLWVIDQLPEPVPGTPGLTAPDWCPAGSAHIATIITSRSRQMPLLINLEVGRLDRPEAIRCLQDELPEESATAEDWNGVAATVGDWPLALELLNRCFATQVLTPAAFLESQRTAGVAPVLDEAISIVEELMPTGALRGLGATFLASLDKLPDGARQLAGTLSYFAEADLPTRLIDAVGTDMAGPRNRVALVARSIVTGGAGQVFGRLQPLFADFLRRLPEASDTLPFAVAALRQVLDTLPPEQPAHWAASNVLAPHAEVLSGRPGLAATDQLVLLHWLTQLRVAQGQYSAAQSNAERAVALAEAVHGPTASGTLALRELQADLWGRLGRVRESYQLWQSLLQDRQATASPEDAEVLRTQVRTGQAAQAAGEPVAAESQLREALALASATLGATHSITTDAEHALAITLLRQGKHADALPLAEDVFRSRIAEHGATHRESLQARNTLGVLSLNLGDLETAGAIFGELAAAFTSALGEDHPETLVLHHNLALVLKRQGAWEASQAAYEDVVSRRTHVLGAEHPGTLNSRSNLASVYYGQQAYEAAREHYEQVLSVQRRVLGEEHPSTLRSLYSLASVLHALGDSGSALAILEVSLPAKVRVLGEDHPETTMDRTQMAEIRATLEQS